VAVVARTKECHAQSAQPSQAPAAEGRTSLVNLGQLQPGLAKRVLQLLEQFKPAPATTGPAKPEDLPLPEGAGRLPDNLVFPMGMSAANDYPAVEEEDADGKSDTAKRKHELEQGNAKRQAHQAKVAELAAKSAADKEKNESQAASLVGSSPSGG